MHLGKGPSSTLRHNTLRALIIRRHRAMLEAEVRKLRIDWLGDDETEHQDEEPSP